MPPLSLLAPAFLAATNLTTNLSITLLTPSTTGFLSISSGSLTCPNTTVSFTGDLLPLVVDYTYTPAYDPSQPWNGTLPAKDDPQGSFDRNGTAEFALSSLKHGWVRFQVQDNTKVEAYSVPYLLKVGSKGVDGCTKPRLSAKAKTALMWLGVFVFPIAAGILLWCFWLPIFVPPAPAPVPEVVQPPVVVEEERREEERDIVEAPRVEEEQPPAYGVDSKVPGVHGQDPGPVEMHPWMVREEPAEQEIAEQRVVGHEEAEEQTPRYALDLKAPGEL
ncbi:hypothetical protein BCR35DRAFT_328291 [Leucosporidium creatinivorum]|uniref:Uncharacterized protein n=1 Tax=Leucosporidium creatinivorum TaxID=106004 RepID=A0A1Y2G2U7_9BASI|nr:hypothetical protein BCR35DRAFT_328291 [Leucosporidium creatinivorum]